VGLAWLPERDWNAAEAELRGRAASNDRHAMAALARLAVARGRFADAAHQLQEATFHRARSGSARASLMMSSAWLALEDARPMQALEDLRVAARDLPDGSAEWARLDALMSEAFLRVGAQPESEAAASRALSRAQVAGEFSAASRALRVQAELASARGDVDDAGRGFRAAVEHAERANDRFELGQSLLSLGVFLGRRKAGRDEGSARQTLSLARTWLASIGAEAKLREVDLYVERVLGKSGR
jgi:tetratricopeptide (TPR) repeat protein